MEFGIKASLGKMRVAYRESVGETNQMELVMDKTIGGAHMYAKLLIEIESTIDEVDFTEI